MDEPIIGLNRNVLNVSRRLGEPLLPSSSTADLKFAISYHASFHKSSRVNHLPIHVLCNCAPSMSILRRQHHDVPWMVAGLYK